MSEASKEVTDANFDEEVLKSELPVLVDFWAEWCGPCKMMAPVIQQVAGEYSGRLKVCKVDTESSQNSAIKYGITAIPTLIVFKNGEEVERLVGAQTADAIKSAVDKAIG